MKNFERAEVFDRWDEILSRRLTTQDPENEPNLSATLPADYRDAVPVLWYDFRGVNNRDEIWCAHDGMPTHKAGYVMECPSGIRFLLGHMCGKKLFGLDFIKTERNFSYLRSQKSYIKRIIRAQVAFPMLFEYLDSTIDHSSLKLFALNRQVFQIHMPSLFKQLRLVHRRDGQLLVDERVRDYAAEEIRGTQYDEEIEELETASRNKKLSTTEMKRRRVELRSLKKNDKGAIYRMVSKSFGILSGYLFFADGFKPKIVLTEQRKILKQIQEEIYQEEIANYSTAKFAGLFKRISHCIEEIEEQLAYLQSIVAFYSGENLFRVAKWANANPKCKGQYKSTPTEIILMDGNEDGDTILLSLTSRFSLPDPVAVANFKNEISTKSEF